MDSQHDNTTGRETWKSVCLSRFNLDFKGLKKIHWVEVHCTETFNINNWWNFSVDYRSNRHQSPTAGSVWLTWEAEWYLGDEQGPLSLSSSEGVAHPGAGSTLNAEGKLQIHHLMQERRGSEHYLWLLNILFYELSYRWSRNICTEFIWTLVD